MTQCSAVQYTSDRERTEPGYLRLEIEPEDAEVIIDDDYRGRIDGWVDHVIPVKPGDRRVELRADGYITQRFDIAVRPLEEVTLELRMEPTFDEIDVPTEETSRRSRNSR